MTTKKLGAQSAALAHPPVVLGWGSVVGRREGDGPLGACFDKIDRTDAFGSATWEKAEGAMQRQALSLALDRAGEEEQNLDWLFAGDLLNQCIGAGFAAREADRPYFGLYGACSTMGEGLILAAMTLDGGFGTRAGVAVSSHFCSAERQYRSPLEYGGQRTPTAQWTVTGSGAVVLGSGGDGPKITHVTVGRVTDLGVRDTTNMGAAMAPAACQTIAAHFRDTGRSPKDYDLIVTGDLGELGSDLLADLLTKEGIALPNHTDCGLLIYDREKQDVHCGGSGCGCCASVLAADLLPGLAHGDWKNILFCPTGALHSPTSAFQGESIPAICHAVALSGR